MNYLSVIFFIISTDKLWKKIISKLLHKHLSTLSQTYQENAVAHCSVTQKFGFSPSPKIQTYQFKLNRNIKRIAKYVMDIISKAWKVLFIYMLKKSS